ncbi:hypothetical protein [Streptomyces sp. NPDC127084]|uniref:hypothetical protein n=1 Tax=Streptomyces sp. NPDC127084 TaxID=3347133 RepID=UPI003652DBD2
MDQLGDKPEQIRKHLEEEKQRHAREAGRGASDDGGGGAGDERASREASGQDDALADGSLGDLGDVLRNESYRGGTGSER